MLLCSLADGHTVGLGPGVQAVRQLPLRGDMVHSACNVVLLKLWSAAGDAAEVCRHQRSINVNTVLESFGESGISLIF